MVGSAATRGGERRFKALLRRVSCTTCHGPLVYDDWRVVKDSAEVRYDYRCPMCQTVRTLSASVHLFEMYDPSGVPPTTSGAFQAAGRGHVYEARRLKKRPRHWLVVVLDPDLQPAEFDVEADNPAAVHRVLQTHYQAWRS